jgi:two-component system, OmpR family, response regulator
MRGIQRGFSRPSGFGWHAWTVRILVVEDDLHLARSIKRGLEAEGFAADVALDGTDGLWRAKEGEYDAIVLDIMLPGLNGYRLCAELRAAGDWTPILMLTAKDGELDEAEALDTGADDYLSKPFSYVVLVARLRALLRRGRGERPTVLEAGDLRLDPAAHRVWRGDAEVTLTPRQFSLLEYLMRRSGEALSKADILNHVWDFAFDGDPNIVEVYVRHLRKKIDEPFDRHAIETVRLVGYRLDPDGG